MVHCDSKKPIDLTKNTMYKDETHRCEMSLDQEGY